MRYFAGVAAVLLVGCFLSAFAACGSEGSRDDVTLEDASTDSETDSVSDEDDGGPDAN